MTVAIINVLRLKCLWHKETEAPRDGLI